MYTSYITNNPINLFFFLQNTKSCNNLAVDSNIRMNFADFAKCSSCYDQTSEIKN